MWRRSLLIGFICLAILSGCQTLTEFEGSISDATRSIKKSLFGDDTESQDAGKQQMGAATPTPVTTAAVQTDQSGGETTISGTITVDAVIDGDTIVLNGRRIRLFGIDAPETDQPCLIRGKNIACGVVSKNVLVGFIVGQTIRCERKDIDRYKRDVSLCYAGDLSLSAAMVKSGYAVAYRKYSSMFVGEEEFAKRNRRGMWNGTFIMPWDWRAQRRS